MLMSQIVAVRQYPEPEIREVTVPASSAQARIVELAKVYETVVVLRTFVSTKEYDQ